MNFIWGINANISYFVWLLPVFLYEQVVESVEAECVAGPASVRMRLHSQYLSLSLTHTTTSPAGSCHLIRKEVFTWFYTGFFQAPGSFDVHLYLGIRGEPVLIISLKLFKQHRYNWNMCDKQGTQLCTIFYWLGIWSSTSVRVMYRMWKQRFFSLYVSL